MHNRLGLQDAGTETGTDGTGTFGFDVQDVEELTGETSTCSGGTSSGTDSRQSGDGIGTSPSVHSP